MTNYQSHVNLIDPTLKFVDDLANQEKYPVYKVERNGLLYVLKFRRALQLDASSLEIEAKALKRLGNVMGVPHLVTNYGVRGNHRAILKKYEHGTSLDRIGGVLEDAFLQGQLGQIVGEIHEQGLADIDIQPRNILVGPFYHNVKIIDLDSCIFRGWFNKKEFEEAKQEDFNNLKLLQN